MKKIIANLFLILLTCQVSAQVSIWVSPDGNGSTFSEANPGSLTGGNLKQKIKTLRNEGVQDIRVLLKEGTYSLTAPVTVDNEMAGNYTHTLTFTGISSNPCSNEGKAIISGGRKVTGWQSAGNGIYKAQLPAGAAFRQLYVDGKMAIRARHPNRENDTDYGPYWFVKNFGTSNAYMVINSSEIRQWRNMNKIEMVIHQDWVHNRTMVNSFEQQGNNTLVNIRSPLTYWGTTNLPYFWENSPDFLDADDEWYLDPSTQELYYKPRLGEDINLIEVIYPNMDRLLNIEGTATKPVQNVTVQNIEFIYSNWTVPSINGIRSNQAVQPLDGQKVETLAQINYAHHVVFFNCNIIGAGGDGITFATGVKNSVIEACRFDQICANGIVIDTYRATQQSAERLCTNNRIANNLIENFGMNYTNALSIAAFKVDRLTIENNEIRYGRYSGLQINNGNDELHDNLIRYNNIHHVMWLHNDGGGIYTMGYQPGTRIYENWVHDMERGPWVGGSPAQAVMLDDHSSDITVENNVFNSLFGGVRKVYEQDGVGPDRNAHDNHISNNESQDAAIMAAAGPKIFPGVVTSAAQSSDAGLSDIVYDAGTLTPAFNTNTLDYTLRVNSDIQKIHLSGITNDCSAVILNNPLEKRLAEGNNPVTITVMAQDGTTKSYTVDVIRDYVVPAPIANYDPTLFYSFDNQEDYTAPTIGSSALLFFDKTGNRTLGTPGEPPTGSCEGPYAGKNAVTIAKDKHVKVLNTTGASDGGTRLNTYSLLFDVQIRTSGVWYALLQTNPANTDDGDIFIRSSGTVGVSATGSSHETLNLDQWYRIIVTLDGSVENGDYNIYANGNLILHSSGAATAKDGRLSLANEFCIFTDEDGEETDIDCAGFAFWGNRVLTPGEVAELGPATMPPTGIKEIGSTAGEMLFYPNPASDILHLNVQRGLISVYDLLGKEVLSTNFETGEVNVSSLRPGTYVVRISANNTIYSSKLIKQ